MKKQDQLYSAFIIVSAVILGVLVLSSTIASEPLPAEKAFSKR